MCQSLWSSEWVSSFPSPKNLNIGWIWANGIEQSSFCKYWRLMVVFWRLPRFLILSISWLYLRSSKTFSGIWPFSPPGGQGDMKRGKKLLSPFLK
jgi:hypothetical protein